MGLSESATMGSAMEWKAAQTVGACALYSVGNSGTAKANTYWSREAKTNDGTEMKMTMRKEMTLSAQVLRLSAAIVPAMMPSGMEMNSEKKFSSIVGGMRSRMMSKTARPGRILTDVPKSPRVTMPSIK